MAISQNHWPVKKTAVTLVALKWVTGRVDRRALPIFDYLCTAFAARVEPIRRDHSWGWAYRAIRGKSDGYSNHASGTAIDLNAPAHPLGARGTFTDAQEEQIRAILRELGGVVRWGGDYAGRKDEMHFEIVGTPAQVAAAVTRLSPPAKLGPLTKAGIDRWLKAEEAAAARPTAARRALVATLRAGISVDQLRAARTWKAELKTAAERAGRQKEAEGNAFRIALIDSLIIKKGA